MHGRLLACSLVLVMVMAGCTAPTQEAPLDPGPAVPEPAPEPQPDSTALPEEDANRTEAEPAPALVATEEPPPEVPPEPTGAPHVVVAQADSGTNPFHPCFRTEGRDPRQEIAGLPDVEVIDMDWRESYEDNVDANADRLRDLEPNRLYWINGTRILFHPGVQENTPLDDAGHGTRMSTITACADYGHGGEAWLVALRAQHDGLGSPNGWDDQMTWVADQEWIDVLALHQGAPYPIPPVTAGTLAVDRVVAGGILAVVSAGNGLANGGLGFPTELAENAQAKGALAVGANDNNGYLHYSNQNPHVVSDGHLTPAGQFKGTGSETSGGTSAAGARVAGYAANVLLEVRRDLGVVGRDGDCLVKTNRTIESGPLADGCLTAADLHAVVRRTADPASHASRFDGGAHPQAIPVPPEPVMPRYQLLGYGEVSEHTLPHAIAVALGREAAPARDVEDFLYEASESTK